MTERDQPARDAGAAERVARAEQAAAAEHGAPAEQASVAEQATAAERLMPAEGASPAEPTIPAEQATAAERPIPAEAAAPIERAIAIERTIPIDGPLDLRLTLGHLGHGAADPTFRFVGGAAWRATRTPDGPATVEVVRLPGAVRVRAWGPGASWALAAAPDLIGLDDDPRLLEPHHPLVRELARRMAGLRIGRTSAVFEALVPGIIGQKVTGTEAGGAYRALIRVFGEPAPGPGPEPATSDPTVLSAAPRLRLLPAPEVLARVPYHAFHPLGLERRRAETLIRVARVAARLEETTQLPPADAYRRLLSVAGIGPWTAAKVGRAAFGDPDVVLVGDFHLPNAVCWALAGEPRGDDARMLELLEPFRGQRGRVIALIGAAGIHAPRYGPPMSPRRIEDW